MTADTRKIIVEHLERLARSVEHYTPDVVVEDAKKKHSPLHTFGGFKWNLREAAEAHWRARAIELMTLYPIKIETVSGGTVTTVQFTRDPVIPHHQSGYIRTESLKDDQQRAALCVAREIVTAESYIRRAVEFATVAGLDMTDVIEARTMLEDFRASLVPEQFVAEAA